MRPIMNSIEEVLTVMQEEHRLHDSRPLPIVDYLRDENLRCDHALQVLGEDIFTHMSDVFEWQAWKIATPLKHIREKQAFVYLYKAYNLKRLAGEDTQAIRNRLISWGEGVGELVRNKQRFVFYLTHRLDLLS